jgi:hypothetical protein
MALLCLVLIALNVFAAGLRPTALADNAIQDLLGLDPKALCVSKGLPDTKEDGSPAPSEHAHQPVCIFCLPLTHPALAAPAASFFADLPQPWRIDLRHTAVVFIPRARPLGSALPNAPPLV